MALSGFLQSMTQSPDLLAEQQRKAAKAYLDAMHKMEQAQFGLQFPEPPKEKGLSNGQGNTAVLGTLISGLLGGAEGASAFGSNYLQGVGQTNAREQQRQALIAQQEFDRQQKQLELAAKQQGDLYKYSMDEAQRLDARAAGAQKMSETNAIKKQQIVAQMFGSAKTPGDLSVRLRSARESGLLPDLTDEEISLWTSDKQREYDQARRDKGLEILGRLQVAFPGMIDKMGRIVGEITPKMAESMQNTYIGMARMAGFTDKDMEYLPALEIPVGKTLEGLKVESKLDLDKATAAWRRAVTATLGPESAAKINKWQAEAKAALIKAEKYQGGGSRGGGGVTPAQEMVQGRFDTKRYDALNKAWEAASDAAAKYSAFNDPNDPVTTQTAKNLAKYWTEKATRLKKDLDAASPKLGGEIGGQTMTINGKQVQIRRIK